MLELCSGLGINHRQFAPECSGLQSIFCAFAKKWAAELEIDGHVQISTFFLENYSRLKPYSLTHGEAMFVVHLMQKGS